MHLCGSTPSCTQNQHTQLPSSLPVALPGLSPVLLSDLPLTTLKEHDMPSARQPPPPAPSRNTALSTLSAPSTGRQTAGTVVAAPAGPDDYEMPPSASGPPPLHTTSMPADAEGGAQEPGIHSRSVPSLFSAESRERGGNGPDRQAAVAPSTQPEQAEEEPDISKKSSGLQGGSRSRLRTLASGSVSSTGSLGTYSSPLACAVCLDDFEAGQAVRQLPGCGHVFHVGCVDPWLAQHATCPMCRQVVLPPWVRMMILRMT